MERRSIRKQRRLVLASSLHIVPLVVISSLTWNAHFMNRKMEDVQHLFDDYGLQIMALTETWHESYAIFIIKRFRGLGFTVVEEARHPSASKSSHDNYRWTNHSGVAVITRHGLRLAKLALGSTFKTFECVSCRVTSPSTSFTLAWRKFAVNIIRRYLKDLILCTDEDRASTVLTALDDITTITIRSCVNYWTSMLRQPRRCSFL